MVEEEDLMPNKSTCPVAIFFGAVIPFPICVCQILDIFYNIFYILPLKLRKQRMMGTECDNDAHRQLIGNGNNLLVDCIT